MKGAMYINKVNLFLLEDADLGESPSYHIARRSAYQVSRFSRDQIFNLMLRLKITY